MKFESLEMKLKYLFKTLNIQITNEIQNENLTEKSNLDALSLSSSDVKIKQLEPRQKNYNLEHINEWLIPDLNYKPKQFTSKKVTSSPLADIDLLI
jgi:hypothetical protein